MFKIFIVEDDPGIASAIAETTKSWGYEAFCASDFRNVMSEFSAAAPDLVLLDIALPFYNGYHWCSEIRKSSNIPIIFISSVSDNLNIVMAMNMGGDDFIAKPFDPDVLIAKIGALMRRAYDYVPSAPVLSHRGAILDTGDNSLLYNGEKIELTKNEYRILLCLLENKAKIVTREKLMEKLWETDCYVDDNTLTVNINRLRKKLDRYGLSDYITTKFGVGYIIK